MKPEDIVFVVECIRTGDMHAFYVWKKWRAKRKEILRRDKHECQYCKAHGKYRKANTVHHVQYLKDNPELALADCYIDNSGKEHRQLVSLCRDCHEMAHGYRHEEQPEPVTPERW